MTKIISIITARSGSKRLKNKNIKKLKGKELIYYTIKASTNCKHVDETYVDTDSKKIRKISEKYGAKVPFLRVKKLSGSKSDSIETIKTFVKRLKRNNIEKDIIYVVLLQPTSPLRSKTHLENAIKKFKKNKLKTSLVSVTKKPTMFFYKNTLVQRKNKFFFLNIKKKEDFKFNANGAIYIFKLKNLMTKKPFGKNILPFVMSAKDSVDIDYQDDFDLAEKLIN